MKRLWWGIFFAALIGVPILAPESNFSYQLRNLFLTLQDSVVAILDAVTKIDPLLTFYVAIVFIVLLQAIGPRQITNNPKFAVISGVSISIIANIIYAALTSLRGQAAEHASLTIAECQQCWAALPWYLTEDHIDTGYRCSATMPFW